VAAYVKPAAALRVDIPTRYVLWNVTAWEFGVKAAIWRTRKQEWVAINAVAISSAFEVSRIPVIFYSRCAYVDGTFFNWSTVFMTFAATWIVGVCLLGSMAAHCQRENQNEECKI
jgi:hypothetical protein